MSISKNLFFRSIFLVLPLLAAGGCAESDRWRPDQQFISGSFQLPAGKCSKFDAWFDGRGLGGYAPASLELCGQSAVVGILTNESGEIVGALFAVDSPPSRTPKVVVPIDNLRSIGQLAIKTKPVTRLTVWGIIQFAIAALALLGVSLSIYSRNRTRKAKLIARQEQEALLAQITRQNNEAQQRRLRDDLTALASDYKKAIDHLPSILSEVKMQLDLAKEELSARAFAPFWDAAERAATGLANYDAKIRSLKTLSQTFSKLSQECRDSNNIQLPTFANLPIPVGQVRALKEIVRAGQVDFEFAVIFEQRKTNKILVSGFSTLGDAISEIGNRISNSLESLSDSINVGFTDLSELQHCSTSLAHNDIERIGRTIDDDARIKRKHEVEMLRALDRIQSFQIRK